MNYYEQVENLIKNNEVNKKVRALQDNSETLYTYWNIGRLIVEAQGGEKRAKYGDGLIKEWGNKLSEKYGKNSAYNSIKISFVSMIIFAIFIYLFLLYTPSNYDFVQESLITVFQYIPRITIASLLAYLMSQICDAKIYQYLKNKFNKVYISSNVSTFISQFVDTIIFTIISFFGIVPFPEIIDIALTMLIFKWVIAILDTPFMLWAVKIKNVKEIE